jgi:hypothetical protein
LAQRIIALRSLRARNEELIIMLDGRYLLRLGVILLMLTSGCSLYLMKANSEEALKQRAQRVWEAKMKGDWGTVYDMADSKFRQGTSREQFMTGSKLVVKGFTITEAKVSADSKEGIVTVKFKTMVMTYNLEPILKENWVFEDGAWRLKLSDQKTLFDVPKK